MINQFPQALEEEAIYILRETAAQFRNPVLLFSGGKDSITLAHLCIKAFAPQAIPFTFVHVDTGHNFPETLSFRDYLIAKLVVKLEVRYVEDSISKYQLDDPQGKYASRNKLQSYTLLDAIEELQADACIGGARRDEEKARAKERIFSVRDEFGAWNPKLQRPELFDMLNGNIAKGHNVRVFPLSNWTELDVWNYILREQIEIPSLYFAHTRDVFIRQNLLWTSHEVVYKDDDEPVFSTSVRYRTIGDITCTAAVASEADSLEKIIEEISQSKLSERGARLDDQVSEAAMEERKMAGYF
ncbi:MAG: sulfate adenylyltransferase subunit CysD [Bacteroidia bacterium]